VETNGRRSQMLHGQLEACVSLCKPPILCKADINLTVKQCLEVLAIGPKRLCETGWKVLKVQIFERAGQKNYPFSFSKALIARHAAHSRLFCSTRIALNVTLLRLVKGCR
jgi:hypothetical protein